MDKILSYNMDIEYMEQRGQGLCELIKDWLNSKGIDALVTDFVVEPFASLVIDFSFDESANEDRVRELTEQILNRFNIKYELDENLEY